MNYKILTSYLLGVVSLFASCNQKTTQDLAMEVCKCYKKVENISNPTGKFEQLEKCQRIQRQNMEELERRGVEEDWNEGRVAQARNEFDLRVENCR